MRVMRDGDHGLVQHGLRPQLLAGKRQARYVGIDAQGNAQYHDNNDHGDDHLQNAGAWPPAPPDPCS